MTALSYSQLLLEQAKFIQEMESKELEASQKTPAIDYDAIVAAARKALKEEQNKMKNDPRVLLTQNEAKNIYGKSVIPALVKRGFLQKYKFDTREVIDKDGEPIKKAKGVIYYRVSEIEKAIEEGNVLSGTRAGTI